MSEHAKLSPSAAHRWIPCPASVRLEAGIPDTSSPHAEEGTFAHEVAAAVLLAFRDDILPAGKYDQAIRGLDALIRSHALFVLGQWKARGKDVPDEWLDACQEHLPIYIDYVLSAYARYDGAVLLIERRVSLDPALPGQFGTADAIVMAPGAGELIDLKFGRGVRVEAERNFQLMLYAYGAEQDQGMMWEPSAWKLTIVQPRVATEPSSWEIATDELVQWVGSEAMPAAQAALEGAAEPNPGDKQCRWCKAAATCTARAERQLMLVGADFTDLQERPDAVIAPPDPGLMAPAVLAHVLARLDEFEAWSKSVRAEALNRASKGAIPGWKLVEGRSNRRWTIDRPGADDQAEISKLALALRRHGVQQPYKPPELIGIGDAEEQMKAAGIGPKAIEAALAVLTYRPPGKPTLARDTDPRPALLTSSAADDFSDVANEE